MGRDILRKVLSGLSDKNIRFDDLRQLLMSQDFNERIKGDHHIFSRAGILDIINIQPQANGKAKPYQVKQIRGLILRYRLHKKED